MASDNIVVVGDGSISEYADPTTSHVFGTVKNITYWDEHVYDIETPDKIRSIEFINVIELTDQKLAEIIVKFLGVNRLALRGCDDFTSMLSSFMAMKSKINLKKFEVIDCPISCMIDMFQQKSIEEIIFSGVRTTYFENLRMEIMKGYPIKKLTITNTSFNDYDLKLLIGSISNRDLSLLNLSNNEITDFANAVTLLGHGNIEELDLSGNVFSRYTENFAYNGEEQRGATNTIKRIYKGPIIPRAVKMDGCFKHPDVIDCIKRCNIVFSEKLQLEYFSARNNNFQKMTEFNDLFLLKYLTKVKIIDVSDSNIIDIGNVEDVARATTLAASNPGIINISGNPILDPRHLNGLPKITFTSGSFAYVFLNQQKYNAHLKNSDLGRYIFDRTE